MASLKKRKLGNERSSFSQEVKQPKPSKKTLDRIDSVDDQTVTDDLPQIAAKNKNLTNSKKRKADEAQKDDDEEQVAEDTSEQASEQEEDGQKEQPKTFRELGIIDALAESCEALGYKKPTPIQAESIPLALQGRDLIGLAETGSGKTAAFALPILQSLMDKPASLFGLVLAPTRELAYQISQSFEALGSLIGVRCAVIVGGMDMVPQAIALGKKPHIVVATPGKFHVESRLYRAKLTNHRKTS